MPTVNEHGFDSPDLEKFCRKDGKSLSVSCCSLWVVFSPPSRRSGVRVREESDERGPLKAEAAVHRTLSNLIMTAHFDLQARRVRQRARARMPGYGQLCRETTCVNTNSSRVDR